jgi:hypothetical protein
VDVRKPTWTSSSFLLYLGALTVLSAAISALAYLSGQYGKGAYAAWTLLPLAVLYAVSFMFLRRGEWIAAGVFAFAGLTMLTAFVAAVEAWWGWLPKASGSAFGGWHWGALLLVAIIFVGALVDLRIFRFPLLVLYATFTSWYFVTDLLSGGGSWSAVLTLGFGFLFLLVGTAVDRGPRRPYGFWVHVSAGLLTGGALLYWWHSGDTDWALVAASGVVFVGIAKGTGRSSWAVFGAGGFLAAFGHFSSEWAGQGFLSVLTPSRDWVPPLVFGCVGFFLVLLGLALGRGRRGAAPVLPAE